MPDLNSFTAGGRVEKQPNRTRKASEREKFHADSDTVPFQIGGKQAVRIRISVNSRTISGIRLPVSEKDGGRDRTRTCDLLRVKQAL